MSQYKKTKIKTGTATPNAVPLVSNCDNCPKVNASYSSATGGVSDTDTLFSTIKQLCVLQREVQELQAANKKTFSFYDSTSKLNKTVHTVVIILMIVPIIQLLCCAGVVYYLGIEEELPGLINWILGGVSVLSLIEMIIGGVKLFHYEKKMDELEKKVDALSKNNNA